MESIDAKSIIRIIKACKVSGVNEIKVGSMEIKFGPGEAVQTQVVQGEAAPTPEEIRVMENEAIDAAVFNQADEELAHMQVDNPALFEELLVNRELEHSGHREEDDY